MLQYLDKLTDGISSVDDVNWLGMNIETHASLGSIWNRIGF